MAERLHRRLLACVVLLLCGAAHAASTLSPAVKPAATRVVSLGGDITEIIYQLQAEATLVGVDVTSVWPAAAQALPQVGYVRQLGAEGILALRPTLAIATHDAGPPNVLAQLRDAGVKVEILPETRTAAAIAAKARTIGALLDRRPQAEALAADVERQARALATKVEAMPHHPRTVFLMSAASGGLMVAGRGTAAESAIALAGGDNVVTAYEGYKPLATEALVQLKPDVLLLMDSRGAGDGAVAEVQKIPAVQQTPAGRAGRVLKIDGQALLGYGARTIEAATALQARLAAVPAP
ncbi:MAG: ABC transporter substrate-binding protein [Solimonas sp.]